MKWKQNKTYIIHHIFVSELDVYVVIRIKNKKVDSQTDGGKVS